jgi:hypothetical protein
MIAHKTLHNSQPYLILIPLFFLFCSHLPLLQFLTISSSFLLSEFCMCFLLCIQYSLFLSPEDFLLLFSCQFNTHFFKENFPWQPTNNSRFSESFALVSLSSLLNFKLDKAKDQVFFKKNCSALFQAQYVPHVIGNTKICIKPCLYEAYSYCTF